MSPHSERPGALLDTGQAVRVGSGPAWRPRCGDAVQTKGSSRAPIFPCTGSTWPPALIWIWILDFCPAAQEHLFSSVLLAEKFNARFGSLSSPLRDSGLLLLSHLSFRPNSLDLFKPLALCAFWRATPTLSREKQDKYTKGSLSLVITQGVTIHGM